MPSGISRKLIELFATLLCIAQPFRTLLSALYIRISIKSMCYHSPMQYDLIAIGDVTTDCFIKLKTAEEMTNHGVLELCMPFGTKLEYESATEVQATGNSANAALCVAKLGISAALVSSVGDDVNGKKVMESLKHVVSGSNT